MRRLTPTLMGTFRRTGGALWLAGLLAAGLPAWAAEPPAAERPRAAPAASSQEGGAPLSEEHAAWLEMVEVLITKQEREYFLGIEREFRRAAFIEEFWKQRDPFPRTHMNELRERWQRQSEVARKMFGGIDDDRARILLINGEPTFRCSHRGDQLEVWFYQLFESGDGIVLLFHQMGYASPYTLWKPPFEVRRQPRRKLLTLSMQEVCQEDAITAAVVEISRDPTTYEMRLLELMRAPEPPSKEWVYTFAAGSTDLAPGTETFAAEVRIDFPGRHQQRTVVQGVVTVPAAELTDFDGDLYELLLTGEVLRDGEIFDRFRYRFEAPVGEAEQVPLVFQRYLRPGDFTLLIKVEDLYAHRFARLEQPLAVPKVEGAERGPRLADSELFGFLAEADAATALGERSIRILPPKGVVHTGLVRFTTLVAGDIERVTFLLDEQPILTKNKPPYSVELDLGAMPGTHLLRATGFDAAGEEAAGDEILLNPGGQRFRVRLLEPRSGKTYSRSLRASADVHVPDGEAVERVELFLNEGLVATLYQPPWVQPILLPDDSLAYVRVVATLADGSASEDLAFINTPGGLVDEVDIHFVELFANVYDKEGRALTELAEASFSVAEDEVSQPIRRFEYVRDLPMHVALMLDVSSSMEDDLEMASDAARVFVEQAIQPKDRAAVIAFSGAPEVEARFTNDVERLASTLEALHAEGGTALYDSLVFSLHYFHGVKGQRALLLLSDGKDESSTFELEGALEYARRAGVTIYAIGLKEAELGRGGRKVLRELAEETGGRAFFVTAAAELPAIYDEIQRELRSQYLIAYQSTSSKDASEFRRVEVSVDVPGAEVRTMTGYYP